MEDLVQELRGYDTETFVGFLTQFVRGSKVAVITTRVPPNEDVALWVALRISSDDELSSRVHAHLPKLMSTLSSGSPSESLERAASLFGFTRCVGALPTAIALCDELHRAGRSDEVISFIRAIAAQLPTEPMLDLLQRKGSDAPYTPFCLRALLKLDRSRAASLLSDLPPNAVPEPFLQSVFANLSKDEQIEALKEIYCAHPAAPKSTLAAIESCCQAVVIRGENGNSFRITVGGASQWFRNVSKESSTAWLNAHDRTNGSAVVILNTLRAVS